MVENDGQPVFAAEKEDCPYERTEKALAGTENFLTDYIRLTPYSVKAHDVTADLPDTLIGLLNSATYIVDKDLCRDFFVVEQFTGELGKRECFAG
jgi:hypothetical protein